MAHEPSERMSVQEFCRYYGITRNDYRDAREKAGVRPLRHEAMLSVNDQRALLPHLSAKRQVEQVFRRIREQPTVTKQFADTRPRPRPRPSIDVVEAEVRRMTVSLEKWRKALVELVGDHIADDGRCARCRVPAPCPTKQTLVGLDSGLVEEIAVYDSSGLGSRGETTIGPDPDRQLRQLYDARDRWQKTLVRLTIEHVLENSKGKCQLCGEAAPCGTKKALMRINPGIARKIEEFATLDEVELEAALGNRRARHNEGSDWGVA